jgi:transcriptional regulator GlxA family with amidase domain
VSFLVASARDTKLLLLEEPSSSKTTVDDDQKKNKDALRASGLRYVHVMALCTGVFLLQSIMSVPVALMAESMAWEERE